MSSQPLPIYSQSQQCATSTESARVATGADQSTPPTLVNLMEFSLHQPRERVSESPGEVRQWQTQVVPKRWWLLSLVPQGILGMSEDSSGSNSWKQCWHLVDRSQEGGWISYRAGQAYHRTLSGLKGQCQVRETKSNSLHVAVIAPVLQPAGKREWGCPSHWEEAWSSLRTSQHSGGCKAQTAEFVGCATHYMHHPAQLLLVMM